MRRNQSSLTAAGIAIARGVESEKPLGDRICYDPYARRFVPGWLYATLAFFIRSGYAEKRGPGVGEFLVARERYIDDVLQDFLNKDLQQLVILGAGYDSRAYRFDKMKEQVKVFEVDHPATQADKLARVRGIFGVIPTHVTFVPVDFNSQTLEKRMPESGYDPTLITLFIWQGVTMYLKTKAVDDTLRFVVQHSTPGSAIVFDYVYRDVLDSNQKHNEISNMRRYRFMTGEGLTFGIEEGAIEAYLKNRGFRLVRDMDATGLKQAYFTGNNERRKIAAGYGIVVAEI
ncbi:MAG TPA: class I SAM-dependent methyltransferase [Anaerolineales bacterium]